MEQKTDITYRKRLQALEQKLKSQQGLMCEKSYFYAQAAHDLKQPLQALKIFVSLLKDERLTPIQADLMQKIEDSTANFEFWLNNLLENAKSDSKSCVLHKAVFNLKELLFALAQEYKQIADYQHKSLTFWGKDVYIKSDNKLIERIIRNLLNNALKYGRGKIALKWYKVGSAVKIVVSDNGIGLKPEEQKHLFEAYYQCSRHYGCGSGLGLAIVKEFADVLHMNVQIYSKWRKGTLIVLRLPLSED